MRHLLMSEPGELFWQDAADPDLHGPGEALVRPLAVATCDLDGPIARGETPLRGPIALGHECVATVLETGTEVRSLARGDTVVVPFQISCGDCDRCRRGLTGSCERVAERSMYGFGAVGGDWGGMLADVVRVPYADAMLVAVPAGIDPVSVASASDNLPDAWRTVAPHLREQPGASVLVLGGGARSIGLYAVAIARALGAGEILYVDTGPDRLATAADLGADVLDGEPPPRTDRAFPIVVDAGAARASLASACRSTAPGGTCTHVGILYEAETPVPLFEMYATGVRLDVGRAMARPAIEPVLDLVKDGRLAPERVTDAVLEWDDAPEALLRPHTKLVFARER